VGGASCCRPIDVVEADLKRSFLEHTREFGPKFVHILAELHDRNDLIDLAPYLVLTVFLQPLMNGSVENADSGSFSVVRVLKTEVIIIRIFYGGQDYERRLRDLTDE
jgi:hypothetical protein